MNIGVGSRIDKPKKADYAVVLGRAEAVDKVGVDVIGSVAGGAEAHARVVVGQNVHVAILTAHALSGLEAAAALALGERGELIRGFGQLLV